jgi:hypothetical protein
MPETGCKAASVSDLPKCRIADDPGIIGKG